MFIEMGISIWRRLEVTSKKKMEEIKYNGEMMKSNIDASGFNNSPRFR